MLLLTAAAGTGSALAQSQSANDTNAALIREIHDLRLAIEKLAAENSRIQVYSVRAAQQGQLISALTTQLTTLNGKLIESQANLAAANADLEQVKDHLRIETDPQLRTALEERQSNLTYDLNHKRMEQSALQAQIDAIRQQILTEQRRLDEFDRWLADSQK
jgi:hypothetical protein